MIVVWSRRSIAELRRIDAYLREQDGYNRVVRRIEQAGASLADYPDRGPVIENTGLRKISVWPYVLEYRVFRERVGIVSIRHARRNRQ